MIRPDKTVAATAPQRTLPIVEYPQEPFVPPGWDYNPADWTQRLPIIALALAGFFIALYLALFQWGVFPHVYEPFFGADSRKLLLDSWVSRLLPVPDAFLGALGYLADAVAGAIGGRARWRTMPWIVVLFGLFVGPFGLISILLVVSQPVLFGAWCTLCLCSALVSVFMIGPAMDEFLASCQYLKRQKYRGRSVWKAFLGIQTLPDEGVPAPKAQTKGRWLGSVTHLVIGAAGIWMMAAPAALAYDGAAEVNDRIVGPLIATFGIVAAWEIVRGVRWCSLVLGLWLMIGAGLLDYSTAGWINALAVGAFVAGLSLIKGPVNERIDGGWATLLPHRPA